MDALWISIQAYTNEVWSGSGSSVATDQLMNNHVMYTLRTTVSFPTTNSPWGQQADIRRKKNLKHCCGICRRSTASLCCNKDNTMLIYTTGKQHAVENMLHWLVRIIFCFNWTQIPQYDSWASAPVATLVQFLFQLLLQIIANRQRYFFDRKRKAIWVT